MNVCINCGKDIAARQIQCLDCAALTIDDKGNFRNEDRQVRLTQEDIVRVRRILDSVSN